jgi:hypothetical protein
LTKISELPTQCKNMTLEMVHACTPDRVPST